MTTALLDQKITYEDYLAWENNQAERHEFIGGRIFAMTGATQKHNLVITNLGFALRRELQGTPLPRAAARYEAARSGHRGGLLPGPHGLLQ